MHGYQYQSTIDHHLDLVYFFLYLNIHAAQIGWGTVQVVCLPTNIYSNAISNFMSIGDLLVRLIP